MKNSTTGNFDWLRLFIVLFCTSSFFGCANKKVLNQITFDKKSQQEILYGFCNLEGLQSAPFSSWYDLEFQNYEPDYKVISNIENSQVLSGVNITIVMATWCSDSRREVPRFYKIMNNLDYEPNQLK